MSGGKSAEIVILISPKDLNIQPDFLNSELYAAYNITKTFSEKLTLKLKIKFKSQKTMIMTIDGKYQN